MYFFLYFQHSFFFIDYKFIQTKEEFQFPVSQFWIKYPVFMAKLLAMFFGINHYFFSAMSLGVVIFIILLKLMIFHMRLLLNSSMDTNNRTCCDATFSRTIVILTLFTLIFCVFTTIGRVTVGLSSRYIPFLIPGFFAVFLHLSKANSIIPQKVILLIFIGVLIIGSFFFNQKELEYCSYMRNKKILWKQQYLLTENIEEANRVSNFAVYPRQYEQRTNLKWKLEYLKQRKLNLYLQ